MEGIAGALDGTLDIVAEMLPDDPRHGTENGYNNIKCRCERCRRAHRDYQARYMRRVLEDGSLVNATVEHGSAYRYDVGCRCDACRQAHNLKSRTTKANIRARKKLETESMSDGTNQL